MGTPANQLPCESSAGGRDRQDFGRGNASWPRLGKISRHAGRRHRRGEETALEEIAAELVQQPKLVVVLDSIRGDGEPQAVAQRDNRLHDRAGSIGGGDSLNERAINTEGADRKLMQVAQGRVSGAKIIDREADAEGGQATHLPSDFGKVAHDRGFVDADFE